MTSILHSSETAEWYTPRAIIAAARATMGGIELDPASCPEANEVVQAARIYTAADDGLGQRWEAQTVWLNPPYGKDGARSSQAVWLHRLIDWHRAGHVAQACALVNAMTGNRWFRTLWAFPLCFLDGRVRFVAPRSSGHKTSPTHSSCVVYLGPRVSDFAREFGKLGAVILPNQVTVERPQGALEL